ncbi:MAG: hypothetical protein ACFFBS_07940 [Promethearchaeota archaeon]
MTKRERYRTEERLMIRTIVICAVLAGAALAFAIMLWSSISVFGYMTTELSSISPYLDSLVKGLILAFFFLFAITAEANVREYRVSTAGWGDIILLAIVSLLLSGIMFGLISVLVTLAGCTAFTFYLHLAQES